MDDKDADESFYDDLVDSDIKTADRKWGFIVRNTFRFLVGFFVLVCVIFIGFIGLTSIVIAWDFLESPWQDLGLLLGAGIIWLVGFVIDKEVLEKD